MMEKVKLNNPFVVYGYKGPEYFCDREAETEKLMSTLHGERNVTLIAPPSYGKDWVDPACVQPLRSFR